MGRDSKYKKLNSCETVTGDDDDGGSAGDKQLLNNGLKRVRIQIIYFIIIIYRFCLTISEQFSHYLWQIALVFDIFWVVLWWVTHHEFYNVQYKHYKFVEIVRIWQCDQISITHVYFSTK